MGLHALTYLWMGVPVCVSMCACLCGIREGFVSGGCVHVCVLLRVVTGGPVSVFLLGSCEGPAHVSVLMCAHLCAEVSVWTLGGPVGVYARVRMQVFVCV